MAAAETKARVWGVWVVVPTTLPGNTQGLGEDRVVGRGGYVARNSQCVIPTPKTFWPKSQDLNSLQLDSCV